MDTKEVAERIKEITNALGMNYEVDFAIKELDQLAAELSAEEAGAAPQSPKAEDWIDGLMREVESVRLPELTSPRLREIILRHYTASQRGKRSVEAWVDLNWLGSQFYKALVSGSIIYSNEEAARNALESKQRQGWRSIDPRYTPVTITYTEEKQ